MINAYPIISVSIIKNSLRRPEF
uniref:Uncharacterized protein n=1 Tax=Rhizophora mucronata TaxID=61149 RepID=A0A2P2QNQ3_RHIMU